MQLKRRHPIFDLFIIAIDLTFWIVCIAGPFALLMRRHVVFALVTATIVIALFTVSFRWRSGHALLPGCLGLALTMWNTATICVGLALLVKFAGFGMFLQLAAALGGIPMVITQVSLIESSLDAVLESNFKPINAGSEGNKKGGE